jgi:hypothetical protein
MYIYTTVSNSTLKYQTSTIIYNDMTDIELVDECKSLLDIASQLQLQNTPIPKLDIQNAELVLNSKLILTMYQSSIREAFTQPDLWSYYFNKFNWTQECIDLINWTSHGKTLSYLPQRQQKTTIQFNTNGYPSKPHTLYKKKQQEDYVHTANTRKKHIIISYNALIQHKTYNGPLQPNKLKLDQEHTINSLTTT